MRYPALPPHHPDGPKPPAGRPPHAGEVVIIMVVLVTAGALTAAGLPMFGITEFLAAVLFISCRALTWLRAQGVREADGI
ncbi:hypothetical protein [Streptomyces jumonjinensis]|uniref:hypothetical protein n=1 Tax=Streptomyces jumonjinensis TaxID=1945 RepID=UPI0037943C90